MPRSAEYSRRYRQRMREGGKTEVLLTLSFEEVEIMDRLKAVQGASSRSDAIGALIRQKAEDQPELKTA
jgi:hypothetical protein